MPFPLIPVAIGGVIAIGGLWYAVDKTGNELQQIPENLKDELVDEGVPILNSISEAVSELGSDIGEAISELGSDLGSGVLRVIRGAGIAVIEGAEDIVDYTYAKIAPHRVEAVTAITAITIYITTMVILFKKIRSAN